MSAAEELRNISRKIKNMAKKRKRALASHGNPSQKYTYGNRCSPQSPKSMVVYVLAGHSSCVAVDFILGRGWRHSRTRPHLPTQSVVETVTGEVEQAFLDAPRSALVALVEDPMGHFEFEDLLCAHQYVMEHSLDLWIGNQNHDRGVAPSREQIVARALSFIPAQAPDEVRVRLRHMLTGAPRKQRKWLARFRNRWGVRIGVLRPGEDVPVALRKQKAAWDV